MHISPCRRRSSIIATLRGNNHVGPIPLSCSISFYEKLLTSKPLMRSLSLNILDLMLFLESQFDEQIKLFVVGTGGWVTASLAHALLDELQSLCHVGTRFHRRP